MKGFTKGKGKGKKFIPTTNKKKTLSSKDIRNKTKVEKSNPESLKQKKMHTVVDIWKFNEASPELQEKIIEKYREWKYEHDNFDDHADYDGLIYNQEKHISDADVFSDYGNKYYDLDRGQYIQFPDLKIKDDKKFVEMLELPPSLGKTTDFSFSSERENNTKIIFHDGLSGQELEFGGNAFPDSYDDYKKYVEEGDESLTKTQYDQLEKASEKWDDMIHQAWVNLRDNYEYQFTDEAIKEDVIANEFDFNEDGEIV